MVDRRHVLAGGAAALAAGILPRGARADDALKLAPELPAGVRDNAVLDALPGKVPLIRLSARPPNYETPMRLINAPITPNDAFFVRYHLADIPEVDPAAWRLKVGGGAAGKPYELTLDALRRDFEPVEVAAVCMCSGNRRGLFQPHVPGVQWGGGAMGCARWRGARLRDILDRAGIAKDAVEVVFDGADGPVVDKTPDFVKSIPAWKANDESVIVAYEMNGEALPHLNGAPARLVVPGWTATYWMKHLTTIEAIAKPFDGFWVKSAYRIPRGLFPLVERFTSQDTVANTPITEMLPNAIIVGPDEGATLKVGQAAELRGLAWDGGYGLRPVEVSTDGGDTWHDAAFGDDLGRFAFRPWRHAFTPAKAGRQTLMARVSNRLGQTQTADLILNPAGYHHNVMPRVTVDVA